MNVKRSKAAATAEKSVKHMYTKRKTQYSLTAEQRLEKFLETDGNRRWKLYFLKTFSSRGGMFSKGFPFVQRAYKNAAAIVPKETSMEIIEAQKPSKIKNMIQNAGVNNLAKGMNIQAPERK